MASVTINHSPIRIELETSKFESIVESLNAQLENLTSLNVNNSSIPSSATTTNQKQAESSANSIADSSMNNLSNKFTDLIHKLESVSKNISDNTNKVKDFSNANKSPPKKSMEEQTEELVRRQSLLNKLRKDHVKEIGDVRSQQSAKKLIKGVLFGAAIGAAYQMGSFGNTASMAEGSINTSYSNYKDFQKNLYNQQINNQQNMGYTISAGIGGAIMGAVSLVAGPIAGAAVGTAASGMMNYFIGRSAGKDKVTNELFLNEDNDNYRLQQLGISGRSSRSIFSGGDIFGGNRKNLNITNFQAAMLKPENAAYSYLAPSIIMSARRDIITGMDTNQAAQYAVNIQKNAMILGADPMAFNSIVGNIAAITNKSTDSVQENLKAQARLYGGDTVSNNLKAVQIAMSTPIGLSQAQNLVNTYQYNDAFLQNKVNLSMASPSNRFKAMIYGQIAGVSAKEIQSGQLSKKNLHDYITAMHSKNPNVLTNPKWQAMSMSMQELGVNMFATDMGGVKPNQNKNMTNIVNNAPNAPTAAGDFAKNVIDALSNITTIKAQHVTLMAPSMSATKGNYKLPNSGTGYSLKK